MAVSRTAEQNAIFRFTRTVEEKGIVLDSSSIVSALADCGIHCPLSFDANREEFDDDASQRQTQKILNWFHNNLGFANDDRGTQLEVFRLVVDHFFDGSHSDVLALLLGGETSAEPGDNGCLSSKSLTSLKSTDCVALLYSVLNHSSNNHGLLCNLLSACHVISKGITSDGSGEDGEDASYDEQLYRFAFSEVGPYWIELGMVLDFSYTQLKSLEQDYRTLKKGPKHMALEMLQRYSQRMGTQRKPIRQLRKILVDVKSQREQEIGDAREPSALPPFVVDDPRLCGRDMEFRLMKAFLWDGERNHVAVLPIMEQKIHVFSGVGGAGKTSLAFRYAYRFRKAYSNGVFYFNAESYSTLSLSQKTNLSSAMQLDGRNAQFVDSLSKSRIVMDFSNYLRRNPRCLLLFDNADVLELLKDVLPNSAIACHVIITSRRNQTETEDFFRHQRVNVITLSSLREEGAVDALACWSGKSLKSLDDDEQVFCRKLAVDPPVEGLPLAVAHAGTFVKKNKLSFQKYWHRLQEKLLQASALDMTSFLRYFHLTHLEEELKRQGIVRLIDIKNLRLDEIRLDDMDRRLVEKAVEAWKKKQHVFLTWEMDLDDVKAESESGYMILQCCSVMSSRGIPHVVVVNAAFGSSDKDDRLVEGLSALSERSLVEEMPSNDPSGVSYSMHHLIQASMIQRLAEDKILFREILSKVASELERLLPSWSCIDERLNNRDVLSLTSHVYSVARKMLEVGMSSETFPGLIDYGCELSLKYQHYATAKVLCTLRLKTLSSSLFKNLPEEEATRRLQTYYGDMATLHSRLGDYDDVEQSILSILSGRSPESLVDADVAFYNKELLLLSESYYGRGMTEKAESLLHRIIASLPLIEKPADVLLQAYLRLAHVYRAAEKYEKQIKILEAALLHSQSGTFDPGVNLATCHRQLAEILVQFARDEEASRHYYKSLSVYKRFLPNEDEQIGTLLIQMSSTLITIGRVEEACERSREGLAVMKLVFSPEDPHIAKALLRHGQNLKIAQKYNEAIKYVEESLSLLREFPEEYSIGIASCLTTLGDIYCATEKKDKAIVVYDEAAQLFRKAYSQGNWKLTTVLRKLSWICAEFGRLADALRFGREAFNLTQTLPLENDTRISFTQKFVICLCMAREFAEADSVVQQMAALYYSSLPSYHPLIGEVNKLIYILKQAKVSRIIIKGDNVQFA
ncbi:uncharacterized protein [Oscarella lobularis]|uniref:uncharacterized protein isoform X2 n=1 Tax=Oscarella lobularis TaxID=121494 RepID=UPI0033134E83